MDELNYSNIPLNYSVYSSITEFDSIKSCKKPFGKRENGKKKEVRGPLWFEKFKSSTV